MTETTIRAGLERYPGWQATLLVKDEDGLVVIERCTIEPQPGSPFGIGDGILAQMLRHVPLTTMLNQFTRLRAGQIGGKPLGSQVGTPRVCTGPVGRKRRTDLDYARWAALYVERAATSRSPIPDLAREFGYSPATVRDLIYKARRKGMLTGTIQGRRGGDLSDKAKQLLAEKGNQ